ncbi:MAG TPA: efflux RND transporter periplasmic adaptor subunit, partial [Candidatus Eisenbacteria bacterium]|nr:efflux RND transporter periplasmic adaptor subunit [Candidatus Eisenbacteria bacterium]
ARGPQRVPVAVALAEQRSVPFEIDATGTVEPIQSAGVTAQTGGLVTRVTVREGAEVNAGAVLFQIDPRPYQAEVASAAAALARSRAQAETAVLDAKRAETLAEKQVISADELQRKRAAAAAAVATVSGDSAAHASARLDLARTTVRAPIGGKTGSLSVNVGDLVRANDATPLITINTIRPIRVRFTVGQDALAEVRRPRKQTPRVEIAPGGDSLWIPGRLAFIDNAVDGASGTLLLKAETPNQDGRLWPGQFVRVRLNLFERPNSIVVPTAAVTNSQQGDFCYVVKADTTVEVRKVTIERTWREMTVIASGVQAGETVVTDGQVRLSPGARAQIRNAPGMASSGGAGGGGEAPGAGTRTQRAARGDGK